MTTAEMFRRFSSSIQPNQVVGLGLRLCNVYDPLASPPTFMMESKFSPTHLMLGNFPLKSINIHWDDISHITLCDISTEACIDVLRRAPALEYFNISIQDRCEIKQPILHPRLRSLHLSRSDHYIEEFLARINLPSLKEWTQDMCNRNFPVAAMVSFSKRSGCCLKVLHLYTLTTYSKGLDTFLQAIPTLEQIHLSFDSAFSVKTIMDDILPRIFRPAPGSGSILVEGHTPEPFLPRLQFVECNAVGRNAPLSWDCIPRLYRQGHRRSLALKTIVNKSDINEETALQLLQLADEGLNLQIFDISIGGYFLENFRKRMCGQGV